MQINIVKVHGILWSGEADSVTVPAVEGELTVLPHHVPLVTALNHGRLVVKKDSKEIFTHDVDGGVLEVTEKSVTMLL
ncbi:MAG: ATP synthase F1, epsilon subunit [Parcubacteria group bacterium GW2011_GWA2_43_11]|nr:MAG: ATP synthase F1, epsilon subunit [Parcubacteria group bacterium GW2011_GWA2_43_11]